MIDTSSAVGHCRWCGVEVRTTSFRTPAGLRAYRSEGAACQRCSDLLELGGDDFDPSASYPVRHGVVVAAVCEEDCIQEFALLPFLFVVGRSGAGTSRIVWEPRYIVRAGLASDSVDPWAELGASMAEAWSDHFVRVLQVPFFTDPVLRAALDGRDLVIGLDFTSARAVATIVPNVRWSALSGLSVDVDWKANFSGISLLPLGPFILAHALEGVVGTAAACRASALRQVAFTAHILEHLRATSGRARGQTVFELLLFAHAARFPESLREVRDGGS